MAVYLSGSSPINLHRGDALDWQGTRAMNTNELTLKFVVHAMRFGEKNNLEYNIQLYMQTKIKNYKVTR